MTGSGRALLSRARAWRCCGLVAFLYRELTTEHPILDLSLYKKRNFAMTQIVMLIIGAALYATTVMIPQFLQEMLGYTATEAGLALSAGRAGADAAVSDGGISGAEDRPAADDHDRVQPVDAGYLADRRAVPGDYVLGCGELAGGDGAGHAVSVCADQRDELCGRAAGEEQRGVAA